MTSSIPFASPVTTSYRRPWFFLNNHVETIYPALFRKLKDLPPITRERIRTSDNDFLDLDWMKQGSSRLLILQHGLEGSSNRPYILGMAKCFFENGYDVCAWNFRGCSGEMNHAPRFYHSGATADLELIVDQHTETYPDLTLIGFSLGGNLTLKFLGEKPRTPRIKRAIAFSVPMDLSSGADNLNTIRGKIYELRFLGHLKKKVREKCRLLPESMDASLLEKIRSVRDFDEYYTGPLHGFHGADDYYRKCSSKFFLRGIRVPTLIVNAKNDPLLTRESLDPSLVRDLPHVFLEIPPYGGHVGFTQFRKSGYYWSEERALNFCKEFE